MSAVHFVSPKGRSAERQPLVHSIQQVNHAQRRNDTRSQPAVDVDPALRQHEPDLPLGWELLRTPDNRVHYINRADQSTHWHPPSGHAPVLEPELPSAAEIGLGSSTDLNALRHVDLPEKELFIYLQCYCAEWAPGLFTDDKLWSFAGEVKRQKARGDNGFSDFLSKTYGESFDDFIAISQGTAKISTHQNQASSQPMLNAGRQSVAVSPGDTMTTTHVVSIDRGPSGLAGLTMESNKFGRGRTYITAVSVGGAAEAALAAAQLDVADGLHVVDINGVDTSRMRQDACSNELIKSIVVTMTLKEDPVNYAHWKVTPANLMFAMTSALDKTVECATLGLAASSSWSSSASHPSPQSLAVVDLDSTLKLKRHCTECGEVGAAGHKFCGRCGSSLV